MHRWLVTLGCLVFALGSQPVTLAAQPEGVLKETLELEGLRQRTTPESSASLTDGRRHALALSIFEKDPRSAIALEELGLHHAISYRWHANFDATKEPLGNSVAEKAKEEYEKAERFLRRAILAEPRRMSAYKELLRIQLEAGEWQAAEGLTSEAQAAMPDQYESWLFGGLVAHLQQQTDRAQMLFDRSERFMSTEDRTVFEDISLFLNPVETARFRADPQMFVADYWDQRDPVRLTESNERKLDHFARLAYGDLWYSTGERRGWETERGQIVLRYGIPWNDASFGAGYSRFNVLEYRDFEFVFEDMTRGGHYSMYSPKAGAGSSWTNDYVIQAGEMAISKPEAYDPRFVERIALVAETSTFRGEAGRTDLYVHFLIPDSLQQPYAVPGGSVGAFLLNENDELVAETRALLGEDVGIRTERGIVGTLVMAHDSGQYELDVEYLPANVGGIGEVTIELDVPSFDSDSLMISDLVAASLIDEIHTVDEVEPGRIVRSGYQIQAMPWIHLPAGSDLLVYFELYGLGTTDVGNTQYRVNAVLEEAKPRSGWQRLLSGVFGGEDRTGVAASFETNSNSSDEAGFLSVGLPADGAGEYRLVLEVTDNATGRTVRKGKRLSLGPKVNQ